MYPITSCRFVVYCILYWHICIWMYVYTDARRTRILRTSSSGGTVVIIQMHSALRDIQCQRIRHVSAHINKWMNCQKDVIMWSEAYSTIQSGSLVGVVRCIICSVNQSRCCRCCRCLCHRHRHRQRHRQRLYHFHFFRLFAWRCFTPFLFAFHTVRLSHRVCIRVFLPKRINYRF